MMEDGRDEQPVCVSVLVVFCKGLIEAVLLFILTWMLLQVLISKHLEGTRVIRLLTNLVNSLTLKNECCCAVN